MMENQLSNGNVPLDQPLTQSDLLKLINKKLVGKEFNMDLYDQLIGQLEKTSSPITIKNFVDVWLQAESRLIDNIEGLQNEIDENQQERDSYIKYKTETENEKLNAYGIMNNSELVVFVKYIDGIHFEGQRQSHVNFVLSCESQTAKTGSSSGSDTFEVSKNFKFFIKTGKDSLVIRMYAGAHDSAEVDGVVTIPLNSLKSQNRIEESLYFRDSFDQELPTCVHLEVQWIYSNQKLYSDAIQSLDELIVQKREEKQSAESYLSELYTPFPIFRQGIKSKELRVSSNTPYMNTVPQVTTNEKKFNKMPEATNRVYSRILLYSIYTYLVLSFLVNFDRNMFLDLLISLLLFSSVLLNYPQLSKGFAIKCLAAIVFQTLLEIYWLIVSTTAWWSTSYNDSFTLLTVRRSMIVFSFVIFFMRVLVGVALMLSYSEFTVSDNEFAMEESQFGETSKFTPFYNSANNNDF